MGKTDADTTQLHPDDAYLSCEFAMMSAFWPILINGLQIMTFDVRKPN